MSQKCVFSIPVAVLFTSLHVWCLVDSQSYPPPCDSKIYCTGDLLHDVQMAKLYPDSKTFVDLNLRFPPDDVYQKYEDLRAKYGGTPPAEVIQEFVNKNFEKGNELEEWTPLDFKERPSLVDRVNDPAFRDWVIALNQISRNLSRKVKNEVCIKPDLFSLICIPNGFVIPGGRFTEIYYWDSLFIIKGLLLCDMKATVRGILENFATLIDRFGFMPNGNRWYYTRRSQPPFFIMMCSIYFESTGDIEFIKKYIDVMEKEYKFWEENRMIPVYKYGKQYRLAHYFVQNSGPRPESYREDFTLAESLKSDEEKKHLYVSLKSAAESGLDFSSKWFIKDGTNKGNLSNIDTPNIIPVELNAYLHKNLHILSRFNLLLGRTTKYILYKNKAKSLLAGINAVLWDNYRHMWFDYSLRDQRPRYYFYLTNLAPLWTESYSFWRKPFLTKWVLDYIRDTGADQYIGGVPTSLEPTGEQWDLPNAWSPLECILVEGLLKLGTQGAHQKALEIANKWIQSNFKGYQKYHKMFEKYDVEIPGQTGGGGEYDAQTGFGWTNGVALTFLHYFGRILVAEGQVQSRVQGSSTLFKEIY